MKWDIFVLSMNVFETIKYKIEKWNDQLRDQINRNQIKSNDCFENERMKEWERHYITQMYPISKRMKYNCRIWTTKIFQNRTQRKELIG